ncbi:uncharacterized protein G2W53_040762 [Senna tora]|uniref:Uncharacterized protein n=1 Tax=Senna tora TaxID=362788 RepID=A0A834W0S5_9FABA|nr:uncharacterized protein G2W53_040762 [Senna tora]
MFCWRQRILGFLDGVLIAVQTLASTSICGILHSIIVGRGVHRAEKPDPVTSGRPLSLRSVLSHLDPVSQAASPSPRGSRTEAQLTAHEGSAHFLLFPLTPTLTFTAGRLHGELDYQGRRQSRSRSTSLQDPIAIGFDFSDLQISLLDIVNFNSSSFCVLCYCV